MENKRYKRLLSNTLIFAVGTFLSKAIVFLMSGFYTSVLTTGESDAVALIQQVGNFIMPIAAIGVYDALMRFTIDAGDRKKEVFSSSMAVMGVGCLAFVLLSPILLLLGKFLTAWNASYTLLIVFFVLCANYQIAVSYYIRSLGKTKLYALQGIVNTVLVIVLNILLIGVFKLNAYGYIISISLANLIVAIWLTLQEKLYLDFDLKLVKIPLIKDLLKYGLPLVPTTLMWTLTNITDQVIVREGVSLEANGMLTWAYKLPTLLTLLTTVFIEAWQLSSVRDSKEGSDRNGFFRDVFKSYSSFIFLAASGLILLIKFLSFFLLRKSYFEAWDWSPTLIVATVFSAFSTFMSSVFMVSKKTLPDFLTALCGAVTNIVLSAVLVRPLGVQGVCIATIVSYVVLFIIRCMTTRRYIEFHVYPVRIVINTLLVSAQAFLQVMGLPEGNLLFIPLRVAVQLLFFCLILAFNFKPLMGFAKELLGSLKRK